MTMNLTGAYTMCAGFDWRRVVSNGRESLWKREGAAWSSVTHFQNTMAPVPEIKTYLKDLA